MAKRNKYELDKRLKELKKKKKREEKLERKRMKKQDAQDGSEKSPEAPTGVIGEGVATDFDPNQREEQQAQPFRDAANSRNTLR